VGAGRRIARLAIHLSPRMHKKTGRKGEPNSSPGLGRAMRRLAPVMGHARRLFRRTPVEEGHPAFSAYRFRSSIARPRLRQPWVRAITRALTLERRTGALDRTRSVRASRGPHPCPNRLISADIGSILRRAVPPLAAIMISPGWRVEPHNQIVRAMLLCFLRCGEVRQRRLGFSGNSDARQRHESQGW
jgi:hypothetical protein